MSERSAENDDMPRPEYGTEDYRCWAVLFNDITYAPTSRHLLFGDRHALTKHLWAQGWRRDVRPEDVTERATPPPGATTGGDQ